MNKKEIKAIEELEEFLICDMPSKVFPVDRNTGVTMFREDFFETPKQIEKYIENHFKILFKELNKKEKKDEM